MTLIACGFLAGVLTFQQLPQIPSTAWGFAIPLFLLVGFSCRGLRFPAALIVGFLWTLLAANAANEQRLPEQWEGQDVALTGVVVGIPTADTHRVRFEFKVESVAEGAATLKLPFTARLSWYRGEVVRSGERWGFTARLKAPRGFANPGGFDYEGWLFSHRIGATGYIRQAQKLEENVSFFSLDQARHQLGDRLREELNEAASAGLIAALTLGDRGDITPSQWETMLATGTNHLMAISGLHIGLVATAVFWLTQILWRQAHFLTLRCPAPRAAAVAALIAAVTYSALAGFSIPTQRALVMVAVLMWGWLRERPLSPWQGFSASALAVLIFDPLSIMSPGFWLSFAAVAWLLYGMMGRHRRPSALGGLAWAQCVVFVGLTPLVVAFFTQASIIAPLANAIAVPWVGWVVVPLALLGASSLTVFPALGAGLLQVAAWAMNLIMVVLDGFAGLPFALWTPGSLPPWVGFAAGVAALLVLAPKGVPLRMLAPVWALPLLVVRPPEPAVGEVWMTLLDVGQGLSVVVRTQNHTLLYDTGPSFGEQFDAGQAVIIPYLRHVGVNRISSLVIGHSDNDHAGGLNSVIKAIAVDKYYVSTDAVGLVSSASPCDTRQKWQWDDVAFEFLNTPEQAYPNNNDNSCVLMIRAGNNTALIAGDIERTAESNLVQRFGDDLRANALIAPHHGSRTSSTPNFIAAARPQMVLFATGYKNRYRFPAQDVVNRYKNAGSTLWDTGRGGALTLKFDAVNAPIHANAYRAQSRYYWHGSGLD